MNTASPRIPETQAHITNLDVVSLNSILTAYLGVLLKANYIPAFDRIIQMILGQHHIATTIHNNNIIYTTIDGADHYILSQGLILTLCNATEVLFYILMHAVHNVPYHLVAMALTVPPPQVHELGLNNLDHIEIRYYDLHAHHLECQASWSDFLVFFYSERVVQITEDRGITMEELLMHYQANNVSALSTFVVPNNVMVPYDPNYPAFQSSGPPATLSPPNSLSPLDTPIAFNSNLLLPNNDDISLSDYSDSEDLEMTDCSSTETDTEMSSDSDNRYSSGSYDFGPFLGPHKDNNDNEGRDGDSMIVVATNNYSDNTDEVIENPRYLADMSEQM
ncbi:hypothetical protein EDD18DRAFT_1099088 [Armillaria luteobubalina]|uniref:Uncharacterized protein n=1 Tax=Armillaria luteobubalina TaxID=153913 RepID=A0AA39QIV9_9AGAR|nr:hypothetical protein EDD18DRAFT_1099088 [Armillaria luteobubalina]